MRPNPITIAVKTSACGTGSAYGGTSAAAPVRNDGRPGTGEAAGREDQQIRPVGEQAETDDELRKPTPQHQVNPGCI